MIRLNFKAYYYNLGQPRGQPQVQLHSMTNSECNEVAINVTKAATCAYISSSRGSSNSRERERE